MMIGINHADLYLLVEEDMLEVDCSVLTPHIVFKTSGHVDRFSDWMCKDPKTGEIFRADHFVEDVLEARLKGDKEARGGALAAADKPKDTDAKREKRNKSQLQLAVKLDDAVVKQYEEILAQIDNYNGAQLGELIKKYDLTCKSGVQPTEPVAFNLMFQTSIGPSSNLVGYLRPETAQGQFLNFGEWDPTYMNKMLLLTMICASQRSSWSSTRVLCPLLLRRLASPIVMRSHREVVYCMPPRNTACI
jgi:glycyl-tRNA synthetase